MKQWLEKIVGELQLVQNPQHQFVSSVCIVCVTQKCDIKYKDLKKKDFIFPLLKMLRVQPENKVCPNVSLLFDLTLPDFR